MSTFYAVGPEHALGKESDMVSALFQLGRQPALIAQLTSWQNQTGKLRSAGHQSLHLSLLPEGAFFTLFSSILSVVRQ